MGTLRRPAFLLAAALLVGAHAPARAGEDAREPAVGMTRDVFARIAQQNAMRVLSDVNGVVAVESGDPDIEFERYHFTQPSGVQPARLWQIVIAYRMPADRTRFARVEKTLTERYGDPTQRTSRPAEHGEPPIEKRVWESGDVVVTLAARPDGETTAESARMQVVVVDKRLARQGQAQRRSQPKGS